MQHGPDPQFDSWSEAATVGEHLDEAFGSAARVDRDEPVVAGLGGVAGDDAPLPEGVAQRADDVYSVVVVDLGEQVDVTRDRSV